MKKKGIISVASVVVICALGLLLSHVFDWSVDSENTSGNIAKSSRFSRKTADENVMSNMQELLANDEDYKKGVVAGYLVMQTRAKQFDALVDVSNEVAGGISDFADVLKDMNKARPMIDNVCASLAAAGADLDAALGGENRPDLAQNTINASLAYTTLQKQNRLADRFISTTDNYLKDNEGDDRLKFIRDQWIDYQKMTAALDQDTKAAAELQDKGYKLTPEQTAATLKAIDTESAMSMLQGSGLACNLDVESALSEALGYGGLIGAMAIITTDGLSHDITVGEAVANFNTSDLAGYSNDVMANFNTQDLAGYANDVMASFNTDELAGYSKDGLAGYSKDGLAGYSKDGLAGYSKDGLAGYSKDGLAGYSKDGLAGYSKDGLANVTDEVLASEQTVKFFNRLTIGSMQKLCNITDEVFGYGPGGLLGMNTPQLCSEIGGAILGMANGEPQLGIEFRKVE